MRAVRISVLALIAVFVLSIVHYALPSTDVVRIVNTDIRRMDFGMNAIFYANAESGGGSDGGNRDIRFIETVEEDGTPMVYRNEDTGWGWPFYFKFDAADLQARAADLVSNRDEPVWIAVRHYGWRSRLLSAFPNATSIRQVDGPDVTFFPWLKIGLAIGLLIAAVAIWRFAQLFWRHRIKPLFGR